MQWVFFRADYLWRGSYPGLWADMENTPDRDRWYQGYVASYLERDVRNLLRVGSLRDFERFLRAAAARTGQTLNMSELGRDVGISASTSREWISVLQASNQIVLLEPYYRSLGKRLAKSPKLYFTDTGLAAYLAGFQSPESLMASAFRGAFWENHVVCQWLRWRDWLNPSAGLWYWRDQQGNEVDLVVEMDAKLHLVECKAKERVTRDDTRGIGKCIGFYGPEAIGGAYVACMTPTNYGLTEFADAVNGWDVWRL